MANGGGMKKWRVAALGTAALAGVCAAVASVNSRRFGRRVRIEASSLFERSARPPDTDGRLLAQALPPPVRRYLAKVLPSDTSIQTVRLQHGGTFRPSFDGPWLPIRGEQYFTADRPGFIWWGRVQLVPGLWIDARDRSVDGAGHMFVSAESTFTIADSAGPALDQGALLRLLGEMVWFPSAFLDDRYLRWTAIDEHQARATLEVNACRVSGVFEFGADDLPVRYSAERYRDLGGGRSALTPFAGRMSDFRRVDGVLVPFRMVALWVVDGRPCEYVRFDVERLELDHRSPYS
jgi:hypothetical protein